MNNIQNLSPLYITLLSTMIAMTSTIIGASSIFLNRKNTDSKYEKFFLGIIYGMMSSSLIMSLILPTIHLFSLEINSIYLIILGISLGITLVILIDKVIFSRSIIPSNFQKNCQIIFSSSLRNIIEGISIGIAFSLSHNSNSNITSAITLSIAMILQNFLESLSISLFFRNLRANIFKLFLIISIPGLLEPIGGVIGVLLSKNISLILPFALSLISTTIVITLIRDLLSEFSSKKFSKQTSLGFILGSALLLFLDKIIK